MEFKRVIMLLFFFSVMGFAENITLVADSSVMAFQPWEIEAYVDEGAVSYPSCSLEIFDGSDIIFSGAMVAMSDHAYSQININQAGEFDVEVTCGEDFNSTSLTVEANSKLDIFLSSVSTVGDFLTINADYTDLSDNPLSSGSCYVSIFVDNEFWSDFNLQYSSSTEKFIQTITIGKSGNHKVKVICSAPSYTDRTKVEYFDIAQEPVRITFDTMSKTGEFGDTAQLKFNTNPLGSSCTTNLGVISGSYYSKKTLSIPLNFLGTKSAKITCSFPEYSSSSKTVSVTSEEKNTFLRLQIPASNPKSFQLFAVVPQYYENSGEALISGTSCVVNFNDQQKTAFAFDKFVLKAPYGPQKLPVKLICSKYGYKTITKEFYVDISPIILNGEVAYPESIKLEDFLQVSLTLNPPISAQCEINGKVHAPTGEIVYQFSKKKEIEKEGAFLFQINESGDVNFEGECSLQGYSDYVFSGSLKTTILSKKEEVSATLVLTVMTIVLALSFVMIRKWI